MESAMEPNHFGDVVNTRMGEEETKMGREQNWGVLGDAQRIKGDIWEADS